VSASTLNTNTSKDARADSSAIGPEGGRKRFDLLEDCRELVMTRLDKLVNDALSKMGEELTTVALSTTKREEQQALLEAVSLVKQHKLEIEQRFHKSFSDIFENRLFNRADPEAPSANPTELTLVDDDVMRDKIAVDKLVHRAKSKLDPDEVLGVRARLAALLEREWFDENLHPAAPEAIFEALKQAINHITTQVSVKAALLDAFEPHITANLNAVYMNVNSRLVSNRILPKIKPRVVGSANTRAALKGPDVTDVIDRLSDANGQQPYGSQPYGQGTDDNDGFMPHGSVDQATLMSLYQQMSQQLMQGAPSAKMSAARMLSDPMIFGVADLPVPSAHPPLLEALSSLQQGMVTNHSDQLTVEDLVASVAAQARDKGSPLDQLTVEIVSLVFDYIYADKRVSDVVKQQLLRLQVVAIKAALIDRSFFARRQHPMRKLVDRISEIGSDPDADLSLEGELFPCVSRIIDGILNDFVDDLSIFDRALEQLQEASDSELARRAETIEALTREAEDKETLQLALDLSKSDLQQRMAGVHPEFMREFLLRWWAPVMASCKVTLGVAGGDLDRQYEAGLRTAEWLIWSVESKVPNDVPKLAALLPKLINALIRGLQRVEIPDEEREHFFNQLLQKHTEAINNAKEPVPAKKIGAGGLTGMAALEAGAVKKPVSTVQMQSDGTLKFSPSVADSSQEPALPTVNSTDIHLQDYRRGMLFDFKELDGEFKRVKLSWISPARTLFVFSRYPGDSRALTANELVALLDSARCLVVDDAAPMDRAMDALAMRQAA
jgi:Protein of unknown function (DUF1631)